MAGSVLIDTNAASALLRRNPKLISQLGVDTELYLPIVVYGELYYGALKSGSASAQVARVEDLLSSVAVLGWDLDTARTFGRVKAELAEAGKMIPVNDLWIAAIALRFNLPVVTQDQHFSRVSGLTVISW